VEFGPLKIRLYGDPCLRARSKPVKQVGPVERMLIAAMFETVNVNKGVGLAAPQVGINEQIFVVNTGKEILTVVNPKILKSMGSEVMQEGCLSIPCPPDDVKRSKTSGYAVMEEGCLSIPHLLVDVRRPKTVWVEFIDGENRRLQAQLNGLLARVFQHEYDHLQGKLILDYLPPKDRARVVSQIKDGSYTGKVLGNDDGNTSKI
jgi:peptide deformylase